jgi:hypothetical protein
VERFGAAFRRGGRALTWASNALEGNTLTLRETQRVLEDGATIAGKSMRDHLEAVNHAAAVRRMHEIADRGEAINVQVMLELHGLLLRGIDDAWAGRIRNDAVAIVGTRYRRRMRTLRQPEWTSRSRATPSAKAASTPCSSRPICTMRPRACIRSSTATVAPHGC